MRGAEHGLGQLLLSFLDLTRKPDEDIVFDHGPSIVIEPNSVPSIPGFMSPPGEAMARRSDCGAYINTARWLKAHFLYMI